jgi:hypothetical protein
MSSIYMKGQLHTTVPTTKEFSSDSFSWLLEQKCLIPHYDLFDQIAIAYDEIKKGKLDEETAKQKTDPIAKKDSFRKEIFEAVNQLIKFTCYESHQTLGRTMELSKKLKQEYITIIFPVLVFDGDMFDVSFDSGEPKLRKKNHVLLTSHYRCPYCKEVESYTIDIVHRSYFNEFLRLLKAHFNKTIEAIIGNRDELLKRAASDKTKAATELGKTIRVKDS